jgi:dihydroxy-acid dehydratase
MAAAWVDLPAVVVPGRADADRRHPPEAAAGGPLAVVQTGDVISLDVAARHIDAEVPDDDLARRAPNQPTPAGFANPQCGWERLYVDHVLQADTGADLDFPVGSSGSVVSRESH